jgi:hypothetical protein
MIDQKEACEHWKQISFTRRIIQSLRNLT